MTAPLIKRERVARVEMQAAMAWWNLLCPAAQQLYRNEHPRQFNAADDITRYWKQHFPKAAACARGEDTDPQFQP